MKSPRVEIGAKVTVNSGIDQGIGKVLGYYELQQNGGEFGYLVKLDLADDPIQYYFKFVRKLSKLEKALK